jgi:hypothetical protein
MSPELGERLTRAHKCVIADRIYHDADFVFFTVRNWTIREATSPLTTVKQSVFWTTIRFYHCWSVDCPAIRVDNGVEKRSHTVAIDNALITII